MSTDGHQNACKILKTQITVGITQNTHSDDNEEMFLNFLI